MSDAVTEGWTLYAVGVAATFLRFYARMRVDGFRSLQAEDYLMVISIVSIAQTISFVLVLTPTDLLHDSNDPCIQYRDTCSWPCQQWDVRRRTRCIVPQ
jgi:hypothetical protein